MKFTRTSVGLAIAASSLCLAGLAQPASAAPGGLDPTFGTGGKVFSNLHGLSAPGDAALQPNGDIVVSGNFGVVRYLPNGTLDSSFGSGGIARLGGLELGSATGVAILANGDILYAGSAATPSGVNEFVVARLTPAGALDPAFGTGGVTLTAFPGALSQAGDAVLAQPDGRILVGGQIQVLGHLRNEPVVTFGALVRYTATGALDTTFGAGGMVVSTVVGAISGVGLDAAGDIFVLPWDTEFTAAGRQDAVTTPAAITASSHGGASAFLPTGQYLVGTNVTEGHGITNVQVREFNPGGAASAGFSNPPFTFTGQQFSGHQGPAAIAVEPNGKIAVIGDSFQGTTVFGAARLNPDGSLDAAFGTGGVLTTSFQGEDFADATLVQPNGDIIAIGVSLNNTTGTGFLVLARYLG